MMESNFSFLPWEYFKLKNYGSFSKEITISIFYLIIIEVLAIILFKIISQRKKLFTKHLIYNDLNYLLKKQRKILFILILVPAISIIINLNKWWRLLVTLQASSKTTDLQSVPPL